MPDKTVFRCEFDAACAGSMHIHSVVVTQISLILSYRMRLSLTK